MTDQYPPAPPSPPCSLSVEVPITDDPDPDETHAATQAALDKALKTETGEMFKDGRCRELVVLFHSVGPHP
jgi:hypothetical protein